MRRHAGAHPDARLARLIQQVVQPAQGGLVVPPGSGLQYRRRATQTGSTVSSGGAATRGAGPGSPPAHSPRGAHHASASQPAPSQAATRLHRILRVDRMRPGAHHIEPRLLALGQQGPHQLRAGGVGGRRQVWLGRQGKQCEATSRGDEEAPDRLHAPARLRASHVDGQGGAAEGRGPCRRLHHLPPAGQGRGG